MKAVEPRQPFGDVLRHALRKSRPDVGRCDGGLGAFRARREHDRGDEQRRKETQGHGLERVRVDLHARAKAAFDSFQTKHPAATGTLAGKTGPLADTLKGFLAAPPVLAPEAPADAWPTYGGDPARTGRAPGGLPRYWPARASWETDIRPFARPDGGNPPAQPPFGHPVIAGGEVFVADAARVYGFDLYTGAGTRSYGPFNLNVGANPNHTEGGASLTAAGGRLFARFGPPVVRAPATVRGGRPEESFLFCLKPQGKLLKEVWRLAPPEDAKVPAAWEGAPLVVGKRLWAVYAKFEGGRVVHVAACFDPVPDDDDPQRPAWTTELCDSPQPVSGDGRARQELLTLAGRNLVFCSNGGAVVAVDAATGQRAWGFRYPRSRAAAAHPTGDPAPAVAFGGRVFVAPADGERVYALDADTGEPAWESGPTEGARIVGVAGGRLIVTVTGPQRGLRGLNLDTGSHRPDEGGWVRSVGRGTLTYGQGLVSDDAAVWPSREGLYFARPDDGLREPATFLGRYFGNCAYADGVLVVVTPAQVWGYIADPKRIVPRPDAPPRDHFNRLVDRAERALAAGDRAEAVGILGAVAASDLPPPLRAWAAARLLQVTASRVEAARLKAALPAALMNEWLLAPDGLPVTLGSFLQQCLGTPAPRASVPTTVRAEPCAPGLAADAEIARTRKLPPGVSPLCAVDGAGRPARLFAAGLHTLVAVPLDRSAVSEHVAADVFTHAADVPDGFVAVGPNAVALYGTAREALWVFRVPGTDRLPLGPRPFVARTNEPPAPAYLSSFRLAGPWLFARVGDRHLIALDLHARRVAWVLGATGRSGYEPVLYAAAPRFGPHFAVCGGFVVAQLSDGRRWFVALHTGRPVAQPALGENTARVSWPHAPAEVGENLLALADGPGLVRLAQLGGRVKWAYEVERDDGLAGEPPQVLAAGDALLVAVRRNHGVEIECVNAADGKPVWSRSAFADAFAIDLSAADADADCAYVPIANTLLALALATGKRAWAADLPAAPGGWVVRAGTACVIAYPARAIPREPTADVLARVAKSFRREPFAWRLPGLALTLYDAWVDRTLPVLLFDPETGARVGRYDLPARGPAVRAWFDATTAVFATGDRVVWLK